VRALAQTSTTLKTVTPILLVTLVVLASLWSAVQAAPHYRLYTNIIGGGPAHAGYYFPQDEFYDVGLREALAEIAQRARPGAHVANETESLTAFYAQQAKRPDLISLSLSDPDDRSQLTAGDFLIAARGRRYFSNEAILSALRQTSTPVIRSNIGTQPAVEVYLLDEKTVSLVNETR
jgi:hypothetical protein